MNSLSADLPHVDEHSVEVAAPAEVVWPALLRTAEASFAGGLAPRFSRLLGCEDVADGGPRPLATGSVLPGFHVAAASAPSLLELAGRHRFSRYALVFRLEPGPGGGTLLRAETRAEFPHLRGRVYRTLVIGTRIHVLVTRRMLGAAKARAERGRAT